MILQVEVAKDLLNNNDATKTGILLAVIVVLIFFIGFLWRAKLKDETYIREQDKENLKMLLTLTTTMQDMGKDVDKISDTTSDSNIKVSAIIEIIKERFKT